jgi:hypothetical protein
MKRSFPPFAVIYSSNSGNTFSTMMPQWTSDNKVPLSEFSTERALGKVKQFEATTLCWFSKPRSGCRYLQKELQS